LKLTVIVPTYNRSDLLGQTLRKLLGEQTAPASEYEIVVVDDGSTDNTPEIVAAVGTSASDRLRYYRQENKGPAAARNLGVREAKGKIILFTGDDCIPDRRLIEEHLKAHERSGDVAIIGHIAWHPDLEITPLMLFLDEGAQFGFTQITDPENLTFFTFYTANCSLHRHWLDDVGGFDEEFRQAAYEDIELAYRMTQRGLRIVYRSSALTYHLHAPALEAHVTRMRSCGRAAVLVWQKHPELKEKLGIIDAARATTVIGFYEAVTTYGFALGVRDAMKGEKPPLDSELGALWRNPELAEAGRAWAREAFGDADPEKAELIRLQREVHRMRESWKQVESRRLYRWSEWLAKTGWRVLRGFGLGRGGSD
jgi:glycosyltransferase involved in cell wall biosynthesis